MGSSEEGETAARQISRCRGTDEVEFSDHALSSGIGWTLKVKAARLHPLRGGVLADAVGAGKTINAIALIASRAAHFVSPSSSMWTWFIRALMGRRVSDRVSDLGGEIFEECVAALHHAKEHPEESNATLQESKRCRRAVPKLLTLHRTPKADDAADDV